MSLARVSGVATLALIYVALLPSYLPLDLAIGVVVGALAVAAVGPSPLTRTERRRSPVARLSSVPRLAAWVAADVASGTWRVALATVGLSPPREPGIVRVPVEGIEQQALVVTGLLLTLSPGSVLVAADEDRRELLVHVVDAEDPDGVRDHLLGLYDRVRAVVVG